jgi:hypothetical protein
MNTPVSYRTVQVDGLSIFYREAGSKDAGTTSFPCSNSLGRDTNGIGCKQNTTRISEQPCSKRFISIPALVLPPRCRKHGKKHAS